MAMDLKNMRTKVIGCKKKALDSERVIDNIYDHEFSKMLTRGEVINPVKFCLVIGKLKSVELNMNCQDARTGESFFHVLCKSIHFYTDTTTIYVVYMLATKIDADLQDGLGDTILHKICVIPGAWRCIVALMRNNASPFIKNNLGFTPEELIIHHKHPEWEENLYWLRKFTPGLMAAVLEENPKVCLIERLLKSWCRTSKVTASSSLVKNDICFKARCPEFRLDLVCIFEKYTNTNEFVLSLLSGKLHVVNVMMKSAEADHVDINTRDHSYQYHYKHYPVAPRPLLIALWETGRYELVKNYLLFGPDLSVKYSFEAEASSPPKPVFFQLVNPKSRPQNEKITALILGAADLSIREENGQTVLFEAIFKGATLSVIQIILDSGVNIAARDNNGRTARDHCILLDRHDYRELIDSFVKNLITNLDVKRVESLVLQLFDGIPTDQMELNPPSDGDGSHQQMSCVLENVQNVQDLIHNLFSLVKAGDFQAFSNLMSPNLTNARDKAGRTFLHYAVQHSFTDIRLVSGESDEDIHFEESDQGYFKIISFLVEEYCCMTGLKNNLGQTVFHYAYVYCASQEVLKVLEKAGNYSNIEDVFGYLPQDYNRQSCGEQTFQGRRKQTTEMDLDIFLNESQFETLIESAAQTGELSDITELIDPLLEYGGEPCFNYILFDCLDSNTIHLAEYLIQKGFNVNISKQYERCNPDNAMCAMMECSHSVTTLRQRAEELGATEFLNMIDTYSKYERCNPDNAMCAMMECSHSVTTLRQRAEELGATEFLNMIDTYSKVDMEM